MKNYDIIVIGAGPGGYTAAIRAAQLGRKVALIEKDEIGGTCLNRGCIPTKTLHASAKLFSKIKKADHFGISVENPSIDLSKVIDRKNRIVNQLRKSLEFLFKGNNIDLIKGEAKLIDRNTVSVSSITNYELIAKKVIISTGSKIGNLPGLTIDEKKIFSSDGILDLRTLPKSIGIVGAGAMGIELACVFNEMGSQVTVFELMPRILPLEDAEVSKSLHDSLAKRGITIRCGETLKDTSQFEIVLVSIGRKLNTEGFAEAGLKLEKGRVAVNEKMETNINRVYAIGDIAGPYLFAHTAAMQGVVAAENACGKKTKIDYTAVPRCIYSDPGVAAVGLTEEQAYLKYGAKNVRIGRFPFRASSKSLIEDERDGFIKVIADKKDNIIGCHIVGGSATEILGEVALAVSKGLKVEDIIATIHAHPTVYESMGEAAANVLKQAISILNK